MPSPTPAVIALIASSFQLKLFWMPVTRPKTCEAASLTAAVATTPTAAATSAPTPRLSRPAATASPMPGTTTATTMATIVMRIAPNAPQLL